MSEHINTNDAIDNMYVDFTPSVDPYTYEGLSNCYDVSVLKKVAFNLLSENTSLKSDVSSRTSYAYYLLDKYNELVRKYNKLLIAYKKLKKH